MSEKLNLRQKLIKIYEEIDHIDKLGQNTNYNYVRAADVKRAIRTAFLRYGIYAETNVEPLGAYDIKTNKDRLMHTAMVKVTIVLYDADSDETKTISGLGDGMDSGDKGVYKAQTGAIKNALSNAFLLPDEAALDPEYDPNAEQSEQYAEQPQPERLQQENAPLPVTTALIDDGVLPTEEQLNVYREKVQELQKELKKAGLKASDGVAANKKFINYLQYAAGIDDIKKMTVVKWNALLDMIGYLKSQSGIEKLVELINNANIKENVIAQ